MTDFPEIQEIDFLNHQGTAIRGLIEIQEQNAILEVLGVIWILQVRLLQQTNHTLNWVRSEKGSEVQEKILPLLGGPKKKIQGGQSAFFGSQKGTIFFRRGGSGVGLGGRLRGWEPGNCTPCPSPHLIYATNSRKSTFILFFIL